MSEAAKFHPEIERALETDGIDIGRVKDVELAHEVAHRTNNDVNFRDERGESRDLNSRNYFIEQQIAQRAVTKMFDQHVSDAIVSKALYPGGTMFNGYVRYSQDEPKKELYFPRFEAEAKAVSEEYNTLERIARRARTDRFNKRMNYYNELRRTYLADRQSQDQENSDLTQD